MPRNLHVAVVGAGWSGVVVARELHDAGIGVEVFESGPHVGGHARMERLNGVMYEPNGAHIFHTSNDAVAAYVGRFGLSRPYEHRVKTCIYPYDGSDEPVMLRWPPQVDELRSLPQWATIEKELAQLPNAPAGEDFETYVISLMGETLYDMFIRDYTYKQWGRPATELSSRFAPKRVDLRSDGYDRLFRDSYEFFPSDGYNSIIEAVARPLSITCGAAIDIDDLDRMANDFDLFVVTSPLDDFLKRPNELEWRGIKMSSKYIPGVDTSETATAAYVVNQPSLRVPFTRTVETKHASGQLVTGTVVSEEYPGADAKHYPVPTVDSRNENINAQLKAEIVAAAPRPVIFCGRLANYRYINMDEAIASAMDTAKNVITEYSDV